MPGSDTRTGFTMLELIMVVAIMAILAAVIVSNLPDAQSQRNRSAADELAVHLRYARKLASSREHHVKVLFETTPNRYSVAITDTNAPGGQVYAPDPVTQSNLIVDVGARFPNVKLSAVNFNGNNVLVFNGTNGMPCDITTNTPLSATGTVTFASGIKVTVTPLTGYVDIK